VSGQTRLRALEVAEAQGTFSRRRRSPPRRSVSRKNAAALGKSGQPGEVQLPDQASQLS
jgi:hypothetical protein